MSHSTISASEKLCARIEFRSDRQAGRDDEMMSFVFPCIFVPFRRDVVSGMVGKEREVCDRETLRKILGLIECLYLEKGIYGISSAQ